jgi:hypothetical protein
VECARRGAAVPSTLRGFVVSSHRMRLRAAHVRAQGTAIIAGVFEEDARAFAAMNAKGGLALMRAWTTSWRPLHFAQCFHELVFLPSPTRRLPNPGDACARTCHTASSADAAKDVPTADAVMARPLF